MNKRSQAIQLRTYTRDKDFNTYEDRIKFTDAVYQVYLINRKLQRLNEAGCNGYAHVVHTNGRSFIEFSLTEEDQSRIDKENTRLEAKALALAKEYGFSVRVQGDPRGSAIKLDLLGGESVDFIGYDTDLIC